MKKTLLFLLVFASKSILANSLSNVKAHADIVNCQLYSVRISLSQSLATECQSLQMDGDYVLKLCDNERGKLSREDGFYRDIFFYNEVWTSRFDKLDFTNNYSSTEIIEIDKQISDLKYSKKTMKMNGEFLEDFVCNGPIEVLQE